MEPRDQGAGGLYVHFPYCVHRCAYCDFNVATPRTVPQARFTEALLAELALRAPALGGPASTLYVGGGTPSLWDVDGLARFVEAARRAPGLVAGAEVTLEANPSEVTPERVAAWRRAGVTRVSLGVQARRDELLRAADRRHDAATARRAVERLAAGGFASWSVDLMFGLPGQTVAAWEADVREVATWGAPHLSVYALTVEPRTVLARAVARGRVRVPGEDAQADMLLAARRELRAAGYVHYEVSSYARPGHRAVHNSAYWRQRPWLGLGPGAHGFLPPVRTVNPRRPRVWAEQALRGELAAEEERLDAATLAFERVMTGLRDLEEGVDLAPDWARFGARAEAQAARGLLALEGRRARLTEAGLMVMDSVLLELLG